MAICKKIIRNNGNYFDFDNKFIFIHVKKTAGKSIKSCLVEQNCIFDRRILLCKEEEEKEIQLLYIDKVRKEGKHVRPYYVKKAMGQENFNQYFKFAFVRNPFGRLVSLFLSCRRKWNNISNKERKKMSKDIEDRKKKNILYKSIFEYDDFSQWILDISNFNKLHDELQKGWYDSVLKNQYDFLSDENGNILVDYIGKFENLTNDFQVICDKLEINNTLSNFHKDKTTYKYDNYRKYYNDFTRKIISQLLEKDLEYFNYVF
jgi:hypothetical protein